MLVVSEGWQDGQRDVSEYRTIDTHQQPSMHLLIGERSELLVKSTKQRRPRLGKAI